MGIDIGRQSFWVITLQYFMLLILFWFRSTLNPIIPIDNFISNGYSLATQINELISSWNTVGTFVVPILISINAFEITRLASKNMVLGVRNYSPMIFYLIISCGIFLPSLASCIASFCIIESSIYASKSFRRALSFDYTFKAGLMLGLACLFVFECIFMAIPLFIALWTFRRTPRECIVSFVGFLFPFFVRSYVQWLFLDRPFLETYQLGWQSINWSWMSQVFISTTGIVQLMFVSLVILIICLSLSLIFANYKKMRKRALRLSVFFCWQLLVSLLIFIFSSNPLYGYSILAIPISVIMPYFFVCIKNRISTILYLCLLLSAVVSSSVYLLF